MKPTDKAKCMFCNMKLFKIPTIKKSTRRCPVCNRKMFIVDDKKRVKFYECNYCNYIEDVDK